MTKSGRWQALSTSAAHWWTDTWLPEILAISCSFSCLAALIIVLLYANGSAIQVWNGLTLNTLVSILAALSKALAIFAVVSSIGQWKWCMFRTERRRLLDFDAVDRASQGPLGCLQYLWHTKTGSWLWVGVATIIAAIAFEPFSQQLVQYDTKPFYLLSARARMPYAHRYGLGQRFASQTSTPREHHIWTAVDFSMQSAVFYGLDKSQEKAVQQLSYQCPSRNCAWREPFKSLAVCSQCKDLSSEMRRTSQQSHLATDLQNDNSVGSSYAGTRFTLPNGLYIDGQNGWTYHYRNATWMYIPTDRVTSAVYMTSFGTGNPGETNAMQNLDTLIWSMSMIRIKPDIYPPQFFDWPNLPLEAMECGLYYCVNSYTANITNGTLNQIAKEDQSVHRNVASWQPQSSFEPENKNASKQTSLAFDTKYSWVPRSDLMLGNGYNVSQAAVDSISKFMQDTFTSKSPIPQINGWYVATGNDQFFPDVSQLLRNTIDVPSVFKSVAVSMSNAIRAGGDGSRTTAGEIAEQTTIYRIEWHWIALPLWVLVAGLAQLALSIVRSRSTQAPIWKNSSLAVLSRGVFAYDTSTNASTLTAMEAAAASSSVTLFPRLHVSDNPDALPSRSRAGLLRPVQMESYRRIK